MGIYTLGHPNFLKEGRYGCFKDGLGPRLWSKLVMKKLSHSRAHASCQPFQIRLSLGPWLVIPGSWIVNLGLEA